MLIEPAGETEFTSDGVHVISNSPARAKPIEIVKECEADQVMTGYVNGSCAIVTCCVGRVMVPLSCVAIAAVISANCWDDTCGRTASYSPCVDDGARHAIWPAWVRQLDWKSPGDLSAVCGWRPLP
ncbi:hypothetical protein N7530_001203 [Penicillium desertorum]|uniref:Uncharacterized protein n=1 Tax=Penicillium desertorum TaxID=1303715 RepID=A0A9W9X9F2_9EURO|nr:hypothetical protein N7530_001203 [Penicillium desertorum]